MELMFTPGCALLMYKPHLADKAEAYLTGRGYQVRRSEICCYHNQHCPPGTQTVTICSGCARRFRREHQGIEPLPLWQIMAEDAGLRLPDYNGMKLSVHDACPSKEDEAVTAAIRKLLSRMNIEVVEAELNRDQAMCCGDSFYPGLREKEILEKMRLRAAQMPCEEVAVHCVSCIKAMTNGGKKARYLLDLIFEEKTVPGELSPARWHKDLQIFIAAH